MDQEYLPDVNMDVEQTETTSSRMPTGGVVNDVTLAPEIVTSIDPREIMGGPSHSLREDSNDNPSSTFSNQNVTAFANHLNVTQPTLHASYVPETPSLSTFPPSRKTGIVYDVRMMLHAPLNYHPDSDYVGDEFDPAAEHRRNHPEEPRRIERIFSKLKEADLVEKMVNLPCPEATAEQATLVHSGELWKSVQQTFYMTLEDIKREYAFYEHHSLYVNKSTALAARLSCGGVISACEAVVTGKVRNAIAVVRPPGHHAEPDQSMGFSFLNNVAVATKVMQRDFGVKRVLILDWDVHHGNGTQRAFFDDPSVLYISLHRHEGGRFYPCSDFGGIDITGEGAGEGMSVNIAWPCAGMGDGDYLFAFQHIVMPIAYEYAPELVIISAGFDAALGDELGECTVTPPCYTLMTHMLMGLAGGKVVVALEGGYNLDAISNSAEAVGRALVGEEIPLLPPLLASDAGNETVFQVAKMHSRYWKNIQAKACQPLDAVDPSMQDRVEVRDIIKNYRTMEVCKKYDLFPVPLASPELNKAFGDQVLSDGDLFSAKTIVLFVHDFGNLNVEHLNGFECQADPARSHAIEYSNRVLGWIKKNRYSVLDVNTLKAFATHRSQIPSGREKLIVKQPPKPYIKLMNYVWDNYLQLCDASDIVLFGYGSGCEAIMSLVNSRPIESRVTTVIQVGGMHTLVRPDPNNDDRREWFRRHSQLYLSKDHPILEDSKLQKRLRTQIHTLDVATDSILPLAMPQIQSYVDNLIKTPLSDSDSESDDSESGSDKEPVSKINKVLEEMEQVLEEVTELRKEVRKLRKSL